MTNDGEQTGTENSINSQSTTSKLLDESRNELNSISTTGEATENENRESTSNEVNVNETLSQKQNLESQILSIEESIRDFEVKNHELLEWSRKHQQSFLWKVLSQMNEQRKSATESLEKYANFVRSYEQPELGTLTKARKRFHKNLLSGFAIIVLVSLVVSNLDVILKFLSDIPIFGNIREFSSYPSSESVLVYASVAALILLLSELIKYYNIWSTFSRKVTLVLWELDLITKSTEHCRNETIRLDALYPQVKDWLEILGNAINRPWHIREDWLKSNAADLSLDTSPFSLRFAQAQENDPVASRSLRRDAIERHLRPGWRSAVFDEQINEIRKSLGLARERLDVDALDRDITFSPGGPRSLVSRYINDSKLLEKVARTQLLPLMKTVQTESIAQSRPPVSETRFNPLSEIVEDDLGLEEDSLLPWDEFLALPIGSEGRSKTPLSIFSFSSNGRQSGHADRYQTIFQGPERLSSQVTDTQALYSSYSSQTKLPLDILIRVDVAGPLSKEDLLISQRTSEELAQFESEYQKKIQEDQGQWRSSGI